MGADWPGDEQPTPNTDRVPQWVADEQVARLGRELRDGLRSLDTPPGRPEKGRGGPNRRRARNKSNRNSSARDGGTRGNGRRAGRRVAPALGTLTVLLLMGTYVAYPGLVGQAVSAIAGEQFNEPNRSAGLFGSASAYPPRGVDAGKEPLGTPAPVPQPSDSYTFIHGDSRQGMVAYDPCRPIRYVTRPDNAPPGAGRLVAEAVAAASKASGFVFIDDGETAESFSSERNPYQPGRYGKRWAPVLIVWETPAEQPRFATDAASDQPYLAGLGGSQAITGDQGSAVFVTGTIQLNAEALTRALAHPDGPAQVGGVIQHELGHVLGLGHVQDPTQLMYEHGQNEVRTFAAGDRTGLAKLGQGRCFPRH